MKKRMLVIGCALLLCLPCLSLAEDDSLSQVQPLLNAIVNTAFAQEQPLFQSGADDQPEHFAYGLFYRLLAWDESHLGFEATDDGLVCLSQAQLSAFYDQVFAAGAFVLPPMDCCDMIARTADGLSFDVSTMGADFVSVEVTELSAVDGSLFAQAQLWLHSVPYELLASDDDSPTAVGQAAFELSQSVQGLFGYRLNRYEIAWNEELSQ